MKSFCWSLVIFLGQLRAADLEDSCALCSTSQRLAKDGEPCRGPEHAGLTDSTLSILAVVLWLHSRFSSCACECSRNGSAERKFSHADRTPSCKATSCALWHVALGQSGPRIPPRAPEPPHRPPIARGIRGCREPASCRSKIIPSPSRPCRSPRAAQARLRPAVPSSRARAAGAAVGGREPWCWKGEGGGWEKRLGLALLALPTADRHSRS
jgi:hypothetical protein